MYEQLNAPFGQFGADTLKASTAALESGSATDDARYTHVEARIQSLTSARDALAHRISAQLDAAAFAHRRVSPIAALVEDAQAHILIGEAHALARSTT